MIGVAFSEDTYAFSCIYTNWKGKTALRNIRPIRIFFGSNQWHQEDQWLMEAVDLDSGEIRVFAMRDMKKPEGDFA